VLLIEGIAVGSTEDGVVVEEAKVGSALGAKEGSMVGRLVGGSFRTGRRLLGQNVEG